MEEEFLMCKPLLATIKSRDVKDIVYAFLAANNLSWNDHFALMVQLLCRESAQDSLPLWKQMLPILSRLYREALAADFHVYSKKYWM